MPPKKENSSSNGIDGLQNSLNTSAANTTTASTAAAASPAANTSATDQAAEQRQQLFLANAKLCRLVRKCPWMYDRNHPNYAKKQILDKSWMKIAKDCDDSMASCKERWRNIRAAFARSINIYKTHGGPNRVKPYYLHHELRFLVKPMLDGQKDKSSITDLVELAKKEEEQAECYEDAEEEDQEDEEEEEKFETDNGEEDFVEEKATMKHERRNQRNTHVEPDDEEEEEELNSSMEPQPELASDPEADFNFAEESQPAEITSSPSHQQTSPQVRNYCAGGGGDFSPDESAPKRLKLRHQQHHNSLVGSALFCDADARFLETLVPDMRMMNVRQKVIFKRKIYQSLEEVFETNSEFPNCSASFSPPSLIAAPHTVTSAAALSVAQSVATLCDSDLLKLSDFMKHHLRQSPPAASPRIAVTAASRLQNGGGGAGIATSTPTQVGIIPGTNTTITRTIPTRHHASVAPATVPATTTTTPQTRRAAAAAAAVAANNLSPWDQLVPIAVKEEIEDVEVD